MSLFLPYSQLMVAALALTPEPKQGLILGHGGGSLAKWLAHYWPALELDVVEFDPTVVRMAEEYFDYHPPANHHVSVKDGRAFLNGTAHMYDVIWMDAFARHMIPFHLTTAEFFSLLRAHLHPDGVLVVNLASSGEGGDLARATAVIQINEASSSYGRNFRSQGSMETRTIKSGKPDFFWRRPDRAGFFSRFHDQGDRNSASQQRLPQEAVALLSGRRAERLGPGVCF